MNMKAIFSNYKTTDYLIRLQGDNEEFEFRHESKSAKELLNIESETICDLHGSRCIRKKDIISIRLDPRPFAGYFIAVHGYTPRTLSDLWAWVELEKMKVN